MTRHRTSWGARGLSGVLAAACMGLFIPGAAAETDLETEFPVAEGGSSTQGRGTTPTAAPTQKTTRLAQRALSADEAEDVGSIQMPTSYPSQPKLKVYPDNTPDASDSANLLGHDDLAPMVMDLMKTSNRVSAQVVGQSTRGRDLYLVTVTAPETEEETAQQTAWRDEIKNDPATAATDTALAAGYKTPIWISANIHGNEWEGTDAAMSYITDLATAPWSEVKGLLRENRLYFSLVLNPDGRTAGTRATALSLDPNRDMITNTTPETQSFIKTAHAIQPLYSADFHGYTSVLQVEPCGPPHGENYEFDLFLPQAYAMALAVENDVVAANIPGNTYFNTATKQVVATNTSADTAHIKIPYRDTASGWDDYPPIFTAQYAAFFGASTSTVELPKSRPNGSSQSPANAVINKAVAKQTMQSMASYFDANRSSFLTNQIESFRRGVAGEAKTSLTLDTIAAVPGPDQWKPLWDVADNQDPVVLPRAYVIPVGADQRSNSDATALVDQLLLHDIEVGTLDADATVAGVTYPAGSFVVDLHQPLRGLANSLLDLGTDISAKVPSMYDISAWSYSYLWGADVAKVGLTTDAPIGEVTSISQAPSDAAVPETADYLSFDVAGVDDMVALNALLEDGVPVSMLEDGSAVVGPDSYEAAAAVSEARDVTFEAASDEAVAALDDESTKGLSDLTVGYTGSQDDTLSLAQLGFDDLVPVSTTAILADPTFLDDIDVLWIGATLSTSNADVLAALQDYVASGRSIVGRGSSAFTLERTLGLVAGTAVAGWSSGNGIVATDTPEDSVLAPYAQDYSFIYPALTFTDLGEGTRVEQTYGTYAGTGNALMAGHWRSTTATNGPDYFAGQPSVVSGESASGAKGLAFGTSVVFRTHTKGGLSQAARALFWAAPEGDAVASPEATTLSVDTEPTITYSQDAEIEVMATAGAGTPSGEVQVLDETESVVAEGTLADGVATLSVGGLAPGEHTFSVAYLPDSRTFEAATTEGVTVSVAKASSTVKLGVTKKGRELGKGKVQAKVVLVVPELDSTQLVRITDKGETIRTVRVTDASGVKVVILTLGSGNHRLRAHYAGSDVAEPSKSPTKKVSVG